jgi:hypothetical protein
LRHNRLAIALTLAVLVFCPPRTKAQGEGYGGRIVRHPPASYVLQMDDGKLLNAEWQSGDDNWSTGERVMLTTESGEGYLFDGTRRTQVGVFSYDPSDPDGEEE